MLYKRSEQFYKSKLRIIGDRNYEHGILIFPVWLCISFVRFARQSMSVSALTLNALYFLLLSFLLADLRGELIKDFL